VAKGHLFSCMANPDVFILPFHALFEIEGYFGTAIREG